MRVPFCFTTLHLFDKKKLMKLKFILDKKYDLEMINWVLQNCPFNKIDFLIKELELEENYLKKMLFQEKNFKKILQQIVNKKYRLLKPYLEKTKILYQKSWNEINSPFFKTTISITNHPWKYKCYFCIVSPFLRGISSWGGNKIIRTWKENPYTMRKITAHELLISHIFDILNTNFQKKKLNSKQKWALAEISAFAICGLEKKMLKFWPWLLEKEKYPLDHTYSELYKLQIKLKPIYQKKKSFKEFLEKGIQIVQKSSFSQKLNK